jgi:hypothetical protein
MSDQFTSGLSLGIALANLVWVLATYLKGK